MSRTYQRLWPCPSWTAVGVRASAQAETAAVGPVVGADALSTDFDLRFDQRRHPQRQREPPCSRVAVRTRRHLHPLLFKYFPVFALQSVMLVLPFPPLFWVFWWDFRFICTTSSVSQLLVVCCDMRYYCVYAIPRQVIIHPTLGVESKMKTGGSVDSLTKRGLTRYRKVVNSWSAYDQGEQKRTHHLNERWIDKHRSEMTAIQSYNEENAQRTIVMESGLRIHGSWDKVFWCQDCQKHSPSWDCRGQCERSDRCL